MTREDVLRISREAGLNMGTIQQYERFAQLVAKKAVEAERVIHNERLKFTAMRWEIECKSQVEIEREACAILCDKMDEDSYPDRKVWPFECATAIRARKYNPTF